MKDTVRGKKVMQIGKKRLDKNFAQYAKLLIQIIKQVKILTSISSSKLYK
jgi:hypothetical protein